MHKEFKSLLNRVKSYSDKISPQKLQSVYEFASVSHENDKRLSGEGVIIHLLETAKILSTLHVDEETLCAAMLHEIPQYTKHTVHDIEKRFGRSIALLVSAFEKIGAVKASQAKDENDMDILRKMFLVMAKDLRVVLIKLADRLHNMQTLPYLSPQKQKKVARETLEIFVPIASRLGVYSLRSTLEDLCFKFLNEREYKNIQEQLKTLGKKRKHTIDEITKIVEDYLKEYRLEGLVAGRFKNTYSIYKKLKSKGKTSIDDIQDIFALRIVLKSKKAENGEEDISDLYKLIGHIHNRWKPIPGRFKDYVGFPKPNGYKSLHTTIIGIAPHSFKEPVEIQIRTENMHEEAEYGIASHWLYKENRNSSAEKQSAQIEWIKSLEKLSASVDDAETMHNLKFDLFQDRIFVFTPKGEVRDLPKGATPIDFAYSVHSDLGDKCFMAKISSCIVPLNYQLNNGEVVEIITKQDCSPKLEWLSFVKTHQARYRIKNHFKDVLEKNEEAEKKPRINQKVNRKSESVKKTAYSARRVIVGGEKNLPIRIAKCCTPSHKDEIGGFVSRGAYITVHKSDCKLYKNSDNKRHLPAYWENR